MPGHASANRASGHARTWAGRGRGGDTSAVTGRPGLDVGYGARAAGALRKKGNLVAYICNAVAIAAESTPVYRFSDLVALARLSWLGEVTGRLEGLGYPGFRRGDSAAMRALARGQLPVGRLGASLGVTRQAARKIADALEQRGYATTERDSRDTRQLNVALTPAGRGYARAVIAITDEINREIAARVSPAELAAADAVLRAALFDDSARERADRLAPPAGAPD